MLSYRRLKFHLRHGPGCVIVEHSVQEHDVQWQTSLDKRKNTLRMPEIVDMWEEVSHKFNGESMKNCGENIEWPASALLQSYVNKRTIY